MSPQAATSCLSAPPIRGFFSLLFLLLLGAVPFQDGDLGFWARFGGAVFLLLLGTMIWTVTLMGFVQDVREPRRLGESVIVANRPRRIAVLLSWVALAMLVISLLCFGMLVGLEGPTAAAAVCLLVVVVALPVSSLLPWLSRRYADGGGVVAVSPQGLTVVPDSGQTPDPLPWSRIGLVLPASSAAHSLVHDAADGLSARVRWRPGALPAVARWAEEGFAPTVAEVRALRLEASWSPDPDAVTPHRGRRWMGIAFLGWAVLVCVLLAVGIVVAVATGEGSGWILLLLGWAPVLGVAILAPRLWRALRTDERRSATVTSQGWFDILHGQGLVPWESIARIEVHERRTVVLTHRSAPPFLDRDLGNRLNHRLSSAMQRSAVNVESAGPLFREIGPHSLPYAPETRAFALVEDVERHGIEVRRIRADKASP